MPVRQAGATITVAPLAERKRTPWEVSSGSRCVSCAEVSHFGGLSPTQGSLRVQPCGSVLGRRRPVTRDDTPRSEPQGPPKGSGDEPPREWRPNPEQASPAGSPRLNDAVRRCSLDRPPPSGGTTSAPGRGRSRSASVVAPNDPVPPRDASSLAHPERRSPPSGDASTNRMRSSPQVDRCSAPRKSPADNGNAQGIR